MLDCVSLELENHDLVSGEESSDYDASFHEATDLESIYQDIVVESILQEFESCITAY